MADGKPRSATVPDDQEAYRGVAFERNESAEGWKRRKAQQEEITSQIMAKLEQVGELMQKLVRQRAGFHKALLSTYCNTNNCFPYANFQSSQTQQSSFPVLKAYERCIGPIS